MLPFDMAYQLPLDNWAFGNHDMENEYYATTLS